MILMCDITRSGDTLRLSSQEYVDGSNNQYRRCIIGGEDVEVVKELPDIFYGVERTQPVTLRISNKADAVDDTWDTIFAAEELRGKRLDLKRDDGVALFSGIITEYTIGLEVTISAEEKDESINSLFPTGVITGADFTTTALDIGYPIPACFGHALNSPCYNIQNYTPATSTTTSTTANKLVDSTASFTAADVGRYVHNITQNNTTAKITAVDSGTTLSLDTDIMDTTGDTYGIRVFDYLVSYGTIESLWVDHANSKGLHRDGALIDTGEYTFDDGTGAPTDHGYTGYATIRFKFEQVGFSQERLPITADVKGLELGGAVADRNFANVIKAILNNATWGLNQSVNAASFTTAATTLTTASWMCDYTIAEQRQVRDHLNELLFACRSRLSKNSSGEWLLTVDGTGASVASFGDYDGYYDNCKITSTGVETAFQTVKTGYVQYAGKQISLACNTAFGEDKTYKVKCITEDDTAKKILSYIFGRATYADKKLSLVAGTEANTVAAGQVITISAPLRSISAAAYRVTRIARRLIEYRIDCEAYDANIFADQVITAPTATTDSTNTSNIKVVDIPNVAEVDSVYHAVGTLAVIDGVLSVCTVAGTPGTFVAVSMNGQWFTMDAATNAVQGGGYLCILTAARTLTLPGSPAVGDAVQWIDVIGNFDTYNLTLARNGKNIRGTAADMTVAKRYASGKLVYSGATYGWVN